MLQTDNMSVERDKSFLGGEKYFFFLNFMPATVFKNFVSVPRKKRVSCVEAESFSATAVLYSVSAKSFIIKEGLSR